MLGQFFSQLEFCRRHIYLFLRMLAFKNPFIFLASKFSFNFVSYPGLHASGQETFFYAAEWPFSSTFTFWSAERPA